MRTINYKVSYEKMISRLPALFAFLETDEQGTCEIVKATRGEQGDYGKIIANVIIPEGCGFYYECKDGETVLKITEKTEKSYRSIIDTYYKALSDKSWEREYSKEDECYVYKDKFLAFVERGIGLRYVGLSQETSDEKTCGINNTIKHPLAPDYIYLGEAKSLLEKMINLQNQVKFYEEHTKMCKDDLRFYQRAKEEYEARNGDRLIEVLQKLVDEADEIAVEYLGYTERTNGLTLDFKVNLVNTIKDLGMVTPYIQEWEAGKRYYKGDVVYYVDDNGYGMTWECTLGGKNVQTDDLGRDYTEGSYDENTEEITFDEDNWAAQSLNWVNRNVRYICPKCGRFYENNKPIKCECGYLFTDDDKAHTYVTSMPSTITVDGKVISQLSSLRRFETYTNRNDEAEYPSKNEDWLWYYRIGRVMNREEKYDEMGNLGVMYDDDDNHVVGKGVEAITNSEDGTSIGENIKIDANKYIINLAAWGDAITSIKAVNDDSSERGTLTIEYIIGAHLKAKKSQLYQINEDFTINGITYKNGVLIPYSIYSKNTSSFKDKVSYKANSDFLYGGTEYEANKEISLDEYNALNEEWYEAIEEFTPNSRTYDVGIELSSDNYETLETLLKSSFDGDYTVTKAFMIDGKTYSIGRKLSQNEYDNLLIIFEKCFSKTNEKYKIIKKFSVGGKTYDVGDLIEEKEYSNFTSDDKKKCITNKNHVLFTFKERTESSNSLYSKGDTITKEIYESLSTVNKNKCIIKVVDSFWIDDYFYKVGEKLMYGTFHSLSDENKEKVEIIVDETFSIVTYYEVGNTISKEEYDLLPKGIQKDPNRFTITVMETFYDGGTRIKKNDEVTTVQFNEIVKNYQSLLNKINIYASENITISDSGKTAKEYFKDEYVPKYIYDSFDETYKAKCKVKDDEWYTTDDDGNYKYYFSDFTVDTDSVYGNNMGVKYTDTYIYYKDSQSFLVINGNVSYQETIEYYSGDTVTEDIYNKHIPSCVVKNYYIVTTEFTDQYGDTYNEGSIIAKAVYDKLSDENKKNCKQQTNYIVKVDFNDTITYEFDEGSYISRDEYDKLSDDDKKNCWSPDESIWSMVEDRIFDKYVNGEYDKDASPIGIDEDEHYYKLYNKMPFYYDTNAYKLKIGNYFKDVEYRESSFEATVDITHVDIEERPLIRYDYYNGVNFQPTVDDDVYIERGVTQAFEKHIKLGEIKTFEDFENYSNGGFFVISKENIDLG